MKSYVISQRAMKIWDMLSCVYIEKADNIKSKLGIEDVELFVALGWLAHDKKIFVMNFEDVIYLSNKQHLDKCMFSLRA